MQRIFFAWQATTGETPVSAPFTWNFFLAVSPSPVRYPALAHALACFGASSPIDCLAVSPSPSLRALASNSALFNRDDRAPPPNSTRVAVETRRARPLSAMVFYYKARPDAGDYTIYMGADKNENEELIKYGLPEDVWYVPACVALLASQLAKDFLLLHVLAPPTVFFFPRLPARSR
jgi:hypothetical protein